MQSGSHRLRRMRSGRCPTVSKRIAKIVHVASVDDILTTEYVGTDFRVLRDRAMGRTAMRGRLRQEYELVRA